jgi:hypothetical protein
MSNISEKKKLNKSQGAKALNQKQIKNMLQSEIYLF